MEKTVKVEIHGTEYIIREMPLKRIALFFEALGRIPSLLKDLAGLSNEAVIMKIPGLLATAYPEIRALLSVATEIDEKTLDEINLAGVTALFKAILEVNDLDLVKKNLEAAWSQFQGKK